MECLLVHYINYSLKTNHQHSHYESDEKAITCRADGKHLSILRVLSHQSCLVFPSSSTGMRLQSSDWEDLGSVMLADAEAPVASLFFFRNVPPVKPKTHTYTHTHNHFTALWTLSRTTRVSKYQKVHFAIFWNFWSKMKITQTDAPTIWMDCHPIQTNWCPHLCHPDHFYAKCPSLHNPPNLSWLGQAPNMLACIHGGLVSVKPKNTSEIT